MGGQNPLEDELTMTYIILTLIFLTLIVDKPFFEVAVLALFIGLMKITEDKT